ncbi:ComEC/Rec2 family competence protein [bacterium]|nr:ComEC/Rec2 family competence protein [bacterium]
MNSAWPVRRPLAPVAVAGLAGTLLGLFLPPFPFFWIGVCVGLAALGWWGPKKLRTPAIWLFVTGVFTLYAGARAFAPASDSLRARAGEKGGTAILQGWIAELPAERVWEGGKKVLETEMVVDSLQCEEGWERCPGRILMRIDPVLEDGPKVGDRIQAAGYLTLPEEPKNPGEFNRRTWLRSRGIDYQFRVQAGEVEIGVWLARTAGALRAHMIQATSAGLEKDPEAAGLIGAMLFGYRDGVGEELKESFRKTGTLHLFAVSGQNLAVVAGLFLWILALTGAVRWRWAWLTLPAVFLFCLATGMEASAQRAFVMISVLYLGWILGRPMDPANWLGVALLALLLWDPVQVLDPGFQLSFLVVAGLMVFSGPWQEKLIATGRPDPWIPRRLVGPVRQSAFEIWVAVATVIAASAAAWAGSLIPGILLFHQVVPMALVANMVAAPLAGGITILAAVSSMAAVVSLAVAAGINWINAKLVHLLAAVLGWLASWPGGHFAVADPRGWFAKEPSVQLVSVENACPTLVSGEGGKWLIDPGSTRAWAYTVRSFLCWHGVNSLNGVILTAGISDRMGAAGELVQAIPVSWWAETGTAIRSPALKQWLSELEKRKEGKQFWRSGEVLTLGKDWNLKVLWPPVEGGKGRSDPGEVEKELILRYGSELQAHVLVQGPAKGGQANLTREWLEVVQPKQVVRWSRAMEEDPSLSVDFAEQAWIGGIELLKLEETGCLTLKPEEGGKWKVERWRGGDRN